MTLNVCGSFSVQPRVQADPRKWLVCQLSTLLCWCSPSRAPGAQLWWSKLCLTLVAVGDTHHGKEGQLTNGVSEGTYGNGGAGSRNSGLPWIGCGQGVGIIL